MRRLLHCLSFASVLLIVWVTGYQSSCERELERVQNLPPPVVALANGAWCADADDGGGECAGDGEAPSHAAEPVTVSDTGWPDGE